MSGKKASKSGREQLAAGSTTQLTAAVPAGLFKSESGHKYIIVEDGAAKVAIALNGKVLPSFMWAGLCDVDVEGGTWLGPYRLRLTHRLQGDTLPQEPGTICLSKGEAVVHCVSFNGNDCLLPLGRVAGASGRTGNYDGWIIETVEGERLFFEQSHSPNGSRNAQGRNGKPR